MTWTKYLKFVHVHLSVEHYGIFWSISKWWLNNQWITIKMPRSLHKTCLQRRCNAPTTVLIRFSVLLPLSTALTFFIRAAFLISVPPETIEFNLSKKCRLTKRKWHSTSLTRNKLITQTIYCVKCVSSSEPSIEHLYRTPLSDLKHLLFSITVLYHIQI